MRTWLDGYNSDIYLVSDEWNTFDCYSHKVNIDELENAYKEIASMYHDLDDPMFDPDLRMLETYEQELGAYDRRD